MPYILALYVKTYRLVTQKSYKKKWIGLKKGDYMTDKQESLLKLAELFKILGDPTRLKIVELLLESEMCVNHIAETMEMGQSAISHQLRVLRQARLVTYRKDGKTAYYSLNDDHVECLVRMGMEHVAHQ